MVELRVLDPFTFYFWKGSSFSNQLYWWNITIFYEQLKNNFETGSKITIRAKYDVYLIKANNRKWKC